MRRRTSLEARPPRNGPYRPWKRSTHMRRRMEDYNGGPTRACPPWLAHEVNMNDLLLRLLGREPRILILGLWAILVRYGLGRTLRDREWGYAVFCGVIALLFIWGVTRAVRSGTPSLTEEPGPTSPSPKASAPIEPR